MLRSQRLATPDHDVFTDASGSYGCGAVCARQWLQLEWPPCFKETPIAPKELWCQLLWHAFSGAVIGGAR